MGLPVQLGQPVVFRPGTASDERWGPGQFLSAMITNIQGEDASLLVFPDAYAPYFEIRVKRDDTLGQDRTWTPSVGEAAGMPEAPSDGIIYGRRNQAWTPVTGTGQNFIQSIIISDVEPTSNLEGLAWFDTTINNFFISEQGKWVEPAHVNPYETVPVNAVPPFIQGNVAMGALFTCTTGDWSATPYVFSYQWYRNSVPLAGQITNRYRITPADVGTALVCAVTAYNSLGPSQPAFSNTVFITVPSIEKKPEIFGVVAIGERLVSTTGEWTNAPIIHYTYQWQRDHIAIVGETNSTYFIVSADVGTNISVEVVATNLIGPSAAARSDDVLIDVPFASGIPGLSGDPFVGQMLMCGPGDWTGSPTTFAYQWMRDGVAIVGQTLNTYVLVVADETFNVACQVTATNGIGSGTTISAYVFITRPATLNSSSAGVTLEDLNMTARNLMGAAEAVGAKCLSLSSAGKWYFEVTVAASLWGDYDSVGMMTDVGTYDKMGIGIETVKVTRTGLIWSGGIVPAPSLGVLIPGDTVQWAFDLTNDRFWVRKNGGAWNGNIDADPEIDMGWIGCGMYSRLGPAVCFGGDNSLGGEAVTFNFGATPFRDKGPIGYYPGWSVTEVN